MLTPYYQQQYHHCGNFRSYIYLSIGYCVARCLQCSGRLAGSAVQSADTAAGAELQRGSLCSAAAARQTGAPGNSRAEGL